MSGATHRIEILGVSNIPEVVPGADLGPVILKACRESGLTILARDVVVVTQKIVSKAEGNIIDLATVEPTVLAERFAKTARKDPRVIEVALREATRIVRMDRGVLITETRDGLVCANSGVDASNVGAPNAVTTLPDDPDASADAIRRSLEDSTGARLAVIVSDTFGRPWREGVVNVAIGVSGMKALVDYRGREDNDGRTLAATILAVADEIASAAELVMGKIDQVPVAIVRGFDYAAGGMGGRTLIRHRGRDLFR